ncbi:hypothetical protein QAD02_004395 [Eretmocerus hayati]|uniref:Uncharacterized protein n=1 Tax=Eretmocerus hayati TaxID=131215 RepID=A0ACC2NPN5_9HYME|nr:hypothetical protein QAD02_004395 [Eretmocerus hayati]
MHGNHQSPSVHLVAAEKHQQNPAESAEHEQVTLLSQLFLAFPFLRVFASFRVFRELYDDILQRFRSIRVESDTEIYEPENKDVLVLLNHFNLLIEDRYLFQTDHRPSSKTIKASVQAKLSQVRKIFYVSAFAGHMQAPALCGFERVKNQRQGDNCKGNRKQGYLRASHIKLK